LQTEQSKKVAQFLDDGICVDRSGQRSVPAPNSLHSHSSRTRHVHLGVIADEDRVLRSRFEAL
jgi:hypothetical protein